MRLRHVLLQEARHVLLKAMSAASNALSGIARAAIGLGAGVYSSGSALVRFDALRVVSSFTLGQFLRLAPMVRRESLALLACVSPHRLRWFPAPAQRAAFLQRQQKKRKAATASAEGTCTCAIIVTMQHTRAVPNTSWLG